ncbi:MAG: hypothetical protein KAT35_06255, partial [Candidatus Aenigmarchaeota archaeon]|nr:hypothetical protein [Candidatus Aenigmarchaeota archaeon]
MTLTADATKIGEIRWTPSLQNTKGSSQRQIKSFARYTITAVVLQDSIRSWKKVMIYFFCFVSEF